MNKIAIFCAFTSLVHCLAVLGQRDVDNPGIKWKFRTEGPVRSGVIVLGDSLYFGSSDGNLYCIGKENGELIWKYQTGGALTGLPATDGRAVYVAGRDAHLYSLDAHTGKLNWRFRMLPDLPDPHAGWDYFQPAPVILGNRVFIGSGDGHLYALDSAGGSLQWKYKTKGRIRATAGIHKNVLYQPANDGYVYALDPESGKLLWKFETLGATLNPADFGFDRSSIFARPLVWENSLIIASRDGHAYSVDLSTHKTKWTFTYGSTWAMASALSDSTLYVGWSTNNIFCALDLKTGEEKWKFQGTSHFYGTPLVLDTGVYAGSADGNLYRFDKLTGRKVWEYPIGQEVHTPVLYDSHTLFFGSDDGYLYAVHDQEPAFLAVYEPARIEGNDKYLLVDPAITPFLKERGFEVLDTAEKLNLFVADRLRDGRPGCIVFAFPVIPGISMGQDPGTGPLRQFLEGGGKVMWMGDVPNFYAPDSAGQFSMDSGPGSQLLGVEYLLPSESGNYISLATQAGRNFGLPSRLKTTGSVVSPEGIIPLSFDEFGRVSGWMKQFSTRPGSGFISFRSWAWNVPIGQQDLELLYGMATYGLK